ncbi:MAG TPA: ABC transporter ATP-binding protein, partial [Candidatus Norongarragalinales archaeon]|nr:ABC transporter ATP-binding protein [Candidatus Norongarragalinales archaeon]
MNQKTPCIQLESVKKAYPLGNESVEILHGIDLAVDPGEFVAIMGPSGSGKSTLLHLLGCLDKPTSGTLKLDGINATRMSSDDLADLRCKKIGFVFQSFNLLANLTARQNVELSMAIAGLNPTDRKKRARTLLERVGLTHRENQRPPTLSGGEKQRVAIARALANEPTILLMDEPTGNLDSKTGEEIMKFVKALWEKQNLTVLLITHEKKVAEFAERTIHIRDGN